MPMGRLRKRKWEIAKARSEAGQRGIAKRLETESRGAMTAAATAARRKKRVSADRCTLSLQADQQHERSQGRTVSDLVADIDGIPLNGLNTASG